MIEGYWHTYYAHTYSCTHSHTLAHIMIFTHMQNTSCNLPDTYILNYEWCAFQTTGVATRFCNANSEWEEANVLECTTIAFIELEQLVSNLTSFAIHHTDFHLCCSNFFIAGWNCYYQCYPRRTDNADKWINGPLNWSYGTSEPLAFAQRSPSFD